MSWDIGPEGVSEGRREGVGAVKSQGRVALEGRSQCPLLFLGSEERGDLRTGENNPFQSPPSTPSVVGIHPDLVDLERLLRSNAGPGSTRRRRRTGVPVSVPFGRSVPTDKTRGPGPVPSVSGLGWEPRSLVNP